MQSIKFKYKETGIKLIWGIAVIILMMIVSVKFDTSMNMHVAMFLIVASYFTSTLIISKKITKGIKELNFDNGSVTIIFFSTFKEVINVKLTDIKLVESDQLLKIYRKDNEKLIAVAYKELLLEPSNWALMHSIISLDSSDELK